MARKTNSQKIDDESSKPPISDKPQGGTMKKPPRGPVIKTRGAPAMTLQSLIDDYVKKAENKNNQL